MLGKAAAAERIADLGGPDRGAVYTPPHLADWVAGRVLETLTDRPATIADFACGQGALLAALRRKARGLRLVGVDVCADDLAVAARAVPRARLIAADALAPDPSRTSSPAAIPEAFGMPRVDGVVLNPPWGIDLPHSAAELRAMGYRLAHGQFDSASLFVELAVESLRPGGVAGLILPDSIFFPAHSALREMLVERTELLLLARLGEGFFPGVFRGTAVVVLRKAAPRTDHEVECMQVAAADRRAVLAGDATLAELAEREGHAVPQARFASSNADFDIAVRQRHVSFVERMRAGSGAWTRWFASGRGVELSKHGEVLTCPACGQSRPKPRKAGALTCLGCGLSSEPEDLRAETIVRPLAGSEKPWGTLVGGDDVGRYRVTPSREILTGVAGINYKAGHELAGPRILVRKTGIGLRAALIDQEAYTTQVVYDYRPLADAPPFMAHYVLGVLCSRTMLAFHLLVSGESEWRSHPYVTQRVINALPIPDPAPGGREWERAQAIAERAEKLMGGQGDTDLDLELEGLVAGLYALTRRDVAAAARVLRDGQDLDGIRELRFDPRRVVPIGV